MGEKDRLFSMLCPSLINRYAGRSETDASEVQMGSLSVGVMGMWNKNTFTLKYTCGNENLRYNEPIESVS